MKRQLRTQEDVWGLYAHNIVIHHCDFTIFGSEIHRRSWNQFPMDTERQWWVFFPDVQPFRGSKLSKVSQCNFAIPALRNTEAEGSWSQAPLLLLPHIPAPLSHFTLCTTATGDCPVSSDVGFHPED